jgi:hypothetical protein
LIRSPDDGQTWSEPVVINNTPLDDRDAGILACSDGTLIVSWFTSHYKRSRYLEMCRPEARERWQAHLSAISDRDVARWTQHRADDGRRWIGHWIRRSTDGGRTWQPPVAVPPSAPHGPVELSDGRLLYLGTGGYNRVQRNVLLLVAESLDRGQSWTTIAQLDAMPSRDQSAGDTAVDYLCEPHLVEAGSGKLLAMARHEARPYREGRITGVLWQFESNDGGHTWSEPRPTSILGKPPHLIRLRDGRVLVSYGYRHEPFGERACLSHDGGLTWHRVVLRDDAPNGDLGYPASTELGDGTVLTVYYQVDRLGEQTCLMATRWRPEPLP